MPGVAEARARLRSVHCPQCAGPIGTSSGDSFLSCEHCGQDYLVAGGGDYSLRYLPASVQRLQAVGAGSSWLGEQPGTPRDLRLAVFTQAHLMYIPIWLVEAYVVGWEFGKKIRARQQPIRQGDSEYVTLQLVEEGVQEGSFKRRRLYQAGTDLSLLGVGRPQMSGREPLLPYVPGELEREAAVLEASVDYEEVRDRARNAFRTPPQGSNGFSRFDVLSEQTVLIYYPLWSLHYRYRGRLYQMTVDARTGGVHSARAPADGTRQLAAMVSTYAALAVALAVVVWMWLGWGVAREPAAYAGIAIFILAAGAYWRFYLVKEVEYHEPFSY
ncbi:MAG: hypothetical protein GXX83_05915 [Gaiellales bacterium]|nr:hypothetical protein [Gaiellales bacterium]